MNCGFISCPDRMVSYTGTKSTIIVTIDCQLYTVLVGGLPVILIGDDPSHIHVIVASGCPPVMSHVRITVELSFIGPDGVCIIDGVDVG